MKNFLLPFRLRRNTKSKISADEKRCQEPFFHIQGNYIRFYPKTKAAFVPLVYINPPFPRI